MRRILIDGNHLTGRCNATLSEMTTSRGVPSGVVYGFLRGLHYLHLEHNVDYPEITVCWDRGRSEKRMALYPEYKANRTKDQTPEQEQAYIQYVKQIHALQGVLDTIGCRQVYAQKVEADDLVGIFSRHYSECGETVLIYSGDHDMHQLVTENIKILDPKKGILDVDAIEKHWGVKVWMIPELKAVMGDSSDNIAGVKGLGPVRARLFLQYYDCPLKDIPAKDQKYVKLARDNYSIIERNLLLMKIPRSWEESFYTEDQALEAMECLLNSGQLRDERKFFEFLYAWELNSILENPTRW